MERLASSGSHYPESLSRVGWNVGDGDVDHPTILPVMARVGDYARMACDVESGSR